MLNSENKRKAYTELYMIINSLPNEERNRIPSSFITNLKIEMNEQYKFELDYSKDLSGQNLMDETKAMLVTLYKKYFANEEEKNFYEKYDKLCLEKVENKKREKYNPDEIFKQNKEKKEDIVEEKVELVVYRKFFFKIIDKFKKVIMKFRDKS